MKGNIVEMPSGNIRLSEAREILQNMEDHSHKDIDAAFEVLIYSSKPEDTELCKDAVEHMWDAPKMSRNSIMIVAAFMTVCLITISTMIVEVLL